MTTGCVLLSAQRHLDSGQPAGECLCWGQCSFPGLEQSSHPQLGGEPRTPCSSPFLAASLKPSLPSQPSGWCPPWVSWYACTAGHCGRETQSEAVQVSPCTFLPPAICHSPSSQACSSPPSTAPAPALSDSFLSAPLKTSLSMGALQPLAMPSPCSCPRLCGKTLSSLPPKWFLPCKWAPIHAFVGLSFL